MRHAERGTPKSAVAALLVGLLWLSMFGAPSSASAAEPQPSDTLAKPLSTVVGRLAEKNNLNAKDCSELAQTTVTYGQRVKSAQQQPPENVIRDALQAVDLGEKIDGKAADWPKLRQELQDLLPREEDQQQEDKKQDEKNQEQEKQDQQQQKDQQSQDEQQKSQEQEKNEQQKQKEQEQQTQQQQQQKNQDAFGDMKDQPPESKPQTPEQKPPPPNPGTQKVGGQQDQKNTEPADPELAMPLQKLDQVRNQDSPAKLQQLMQGKQEKPKATGKDW